MTECVIYYEWAEDNNAHHDRFKCTECEKSFNSFKGRDRHTSRHHAIPKPQCEMCNKEFANEKALEKHLDVKHLDRANKYTTECPICHVQVQKLKPHMRQKHENKQKLDVYGGVCPHCSKSFVNDYKVKRHILQVHDNVRPFTCVQCQKAFLDKKDLKRHVLGVHLGEKVNRWGSKAANNAPTTTQIVKKHFQITDRLDGTKKSYSTDDRCTSGTFNSSGIYFSADSLGASVQTKPPADLLVPEQTDLLVTQQSDLLVPDETDMLVTDQPDLLVTEQCDPLENKHLVTEQSDLLDAKQSDTLATEQTDLLISEQSDLLVTKQPTPLVTEQPDLLVREKSNLFVTQQTDLLVPDQTDLLVAEQPDLLINDQSDLLVAAPHQTVLTLGEDGRSVGDEEGGVEGQDCNISASEWTPIIAVIQGGVGPGCGDGQQLETVIVETQNECIRGEVEVEGGAITILQEPTTTSQHLIKYKSLSGGESGSSESLSFTNHRQDDCGEALLITDFEKTVDACDPSGDTLYVKNEDDVEGLNKQDDCIVIRMDSDGRIEGDEFHSGSVLSADSDSSGAVKAADNSDRYSIKRSRLDSTGDIVLELIEEGEEGGDGGGERDEEGGEARIQRVEADANFVTLRWGEEVVSRQPPPPAAPPALTAAALGDFAFPAIIDGRLPEILFSESVEDEDARNKDNGEADGGGGGETGGGGGGEGVLTIDDLSDTNLARDERREKLAAPPPPTAPPAPRKKVRRKIVDPTEIDEDTVGCPYDGCDKQFKGKPKMLQYYRHYERVHLQVKHHACKYCLFKFYSKHDLMRHIESVHSRIKTVCPVAGCNKLVVRLDLHIKNTHSEKPEDKSPKSTCDECGASFNRVYDMQRHKEAIHLGWKKFKCEDCGRGFTDKRDMLRHHRAVHLKIRQERAYQCTNCGRKYRLKRALAQHLASLECRQQPTTSQQQ